MIKPLIKTAIMLTLLMVVFSLLGCPASMSAIPDTAKESKFTTGCYVVEANAKLGLVNSGGGMEVCKLVCSKTLPKHFYYKYENRGCNAEVGNRETRGSSHD